MPHARLHGQGQQLMGPLLQHSLCAPSSGVGICKPPHLAAFGLSVGDMAAPVMSITLVRGRRKAWKGGGDSWWPWVGAAYCWRCWLPQRPKHHTTVLTSNTLCIHRTCMAEADPCPSLPTQPTSIPRCSASGSEAVADERAAAASCAAWDSFSETYRRLVARAMAAATRGNGSMPRYGADERCCLLGVSVQGTRR